MTRPLARLLSYCTERRHLAAGLTSVLLAVLWITMWTAWGRRLELRSLDRLIPLNSPLKDQGVTIPRLAAARKDVVTLYGSSELLKDTAGRASEFFRTYPSGFTVNPIGKPGTTPFIMAQKIAALGRAARGRKFVISLSPSFFYLEANDAEAYAANFSVLQAEKCLFNSALSLPLRRDLASRMAAYPATLEHQPLLATIVRDLSENTPASRLRLRTLTPLGEFTEAAQELQEESGARDFLAGRGARLSLPVRQKTALPWPELRAHFSAMAPEYRDRAEDRALMQKVGSWWAGGGFRDALDRSARWQDLDLLLRTVNELGAQVLVLCIPINGPAFDRVGIPPEARAVFYDRLEAACRSRKTAVLDFREYDEDTRFVIDNHDHLSPKGWIYFDEAIDAFYHGRLSHESTRATRAPQG